MFLNAFSFIKIIDNEIYIGGQNYLGRYEVKNNQLVVIKEQNYVWDANIMNGSDIGYNVTIEDIPKVFDTGPISYAFDTCLNWKQEHENDKLMRKTPFDYQHWKFHTPSGDWQTMNHVCMNSFIKSVEKIDNNTLWVCGTFGAFPRAFSVNRKDLTFKQFVDVNMMSCARYEDESTVTYTDKLNNIFVASGWGLYRPDKKDPDVPDNNSTMLYADWRLYRNLFTLPSAMAWVLSSDVNFINVVKETDDHLFFFGHEINNQYGLNNQEDRNAWQSFLLRICKSDLGFKYIPAEKDMVVTLKHQTATSYYMGRFFPPDVKSTEDFMLNPYHEQLDYNKSWYDNTVHLPKRHFVTPLKINFGCYIGKRPRAISDNHFWGDTNVVYLNKLADVIFDPNRRVKFQSGDTYRFGCNNNTHDQIPLISIFNKEGLAGTKVEPTGALCQLQINANIFNEIGIKKTIYNKHNSLQADNAYEEIMALSSTSFSNFYSRSMHRTNGYTHNPYWNQGVLIGPPYKQCFAKIGSCQSDTFYKNLNTKQFLDIQNFSNIAWPNELPNRLSSIPSSICQYSAAELYSFNASFIVPGVEFKKIFLIKENITNYVGNKIKNQIVDRKSSPLMIVLILSTTGQMYRVVLCDFDNGMINHGEDKSSDKWYNWCIFRHTDQPYLYRQYTPMENRTRGCSYQYRASSLLQNKKIVISDDERSFPINRDPQFHIVKDVLRKGNYLYVVTTKNIHPVNIDIDCSTAYTKCIDCASDPECMWNIKGNKCVKYDEKQYKENTMVQDVLDRGFRCVTLLKKIKPESVYINGILTLSCSNSDFWRGPVKWKINNVPISHESTKYLINAKENYLTILKEDRDIQNATCYGEKDDHDKLYDNTEYEWIDSKYLLVDLSVYEISKGSVINNLSIILIIFIIILILIIIVLSVLLYKKRKRQKKWNIEIDRTTSNLINYEIITPRQESEEVKVESEK